MHELVWRHFRREGPAAVLAPLPAESGGSTLACFTPRGGAAPVWVAKVARSPAGCLRLRREWRALQFLRPWAAQVGAPAPLDWQEEETRACLVQSGLPGRIPWWPCSRRGLGWRGRRVVRRAAAWLASFQALVPAPRQVGLQNLCREWMRDHATEIEGLLPQSLLAMLAAEVSPTPLPAVAIHGDFWFGNLLLARDGLRVTDWCGFDAGSPLDDLLLLLAKCPSRGANRAALFQALFFARCGLAAAARALAERFALPAGALRWCFYYFLARRIWWEAGYSYQSRSAEEQAASRGEWTPSLLWLEARGYPEPWANAN